MNVALWIIAIVVAGTFGSAGLLKIIRPKSQLATMGLAWVEDFSPRTIKIIGTLEVLAAIGLIVPPLVDIATIFVPLAALGLVVLMIGAAVTHGRRHEPQMVVVNVVLLILAGVVMIGRFGPYAF
jgi:hypothetical protein